MNRPDWDLYFMSLALMGTSRSPDARTRHCAIFVGPDRNPLSIGYNGFATNMPDIEIGADPSVKYEYVVHAEINAIINAAKTGSSLVGSTCYLSGKSCHRCISAMVNSGCKRLVLGPIWSVMINENPQFDKVYNDVVKNNPQLVIEEFDRIPELLEQFQNVQDYLGEKVKSRVQNHDIITPKVV